MKFAKGDYIENIYNNTVFLITECYKELYEVMYVPSGMKFTINACYENEYEIVPKPEGYSDIIVNNKTTNTAPDILKRAEEIMRERGKQYDQEGGERSMEKIVNTFNAATGHNLTEAQGWMFMIFLKLIRDNSRSEGHQDSCEDLVAYSSLYGESRLS